MSWYRRAIPCASLILSSTAAAFAPISSSPIRGLRSSTAAAFAPISPSPIRLRSIHCSLDQLHTSTKMMSNEGNNNYIDKLALIMINSENKQLVARSYGKNVYYTPGGKRESGESDEEALLRECREELDVDLLSATKTPATIEPYGTFQAQAYGKPEGTMVRMTCFRVVPREAEIELVSLVKPSEEVEELAWIDSKFDHDKLTVTGIMILEDLMEKKLID